MLHSVNISVRLLHHKLVISLSILRGLPLQEPCTIASQDLQQRTIHPTQYDMLEQQSQARTAGMSSHA